MKTKITKWGNSLALRIPAALADQFRLKEGSAVEVIANSRGLLIRKPKYELADLVAGITDENRHPEVDTGGAVGKEEW